jgi:phospholipid/cholesterol/gamma-HCH transport system permease protein
MAPSPAGRIEGDGETLRVSLSGDWISSAGGVLERTADDIGERCGTAGRVVFDLRHLDRLDTMGAWLLNRLRARLEAAGRSCSVEGADRRQAILLDEIVYREFPKPGGRPGWTVVDVLADTGETVATAGKDILGGVAFLGEVMAALGRLIVNPGHFRYRSVIHHMEQVAFRGVPIVALISFLVGAIVAQQGIFQLNRFGATLFVVDLIGILVLRELGVLLTAIMIAGRSGSAFTAEIGSMKMREEIDALRVMGLDPVEVLVVPRLIALIVGLPLVTVIADLAALAGGGVVAALYGGISTDVFLARLQSAIGVNTFMVGLIKAPFMALVIGIIATIEGLAVKGSAESLGRQVTASVVKAIFVVIVVDGLFAMFFAAVRY